MNDLIAFLLTRLDAEERIASMAHDTRHDWVAQTDAFGGTQKVVGMSGHRVLAECRAKRRVIAEYERLGSMNAGKQPDHGAAIMAMMDGLEIALREWAQVWREHPEFREEWVK